MFRLAKEHKIKMVISGQNFATENSMPKAWAKINVTLNISQYIENLVK